MKPPTRTKLFMFIVGMLIAIQLFWLFGVEDYRSPNIAGYLVLALPAILVVYVIWRQTRGRW
ncbi:MAG: hypothetical protein HWN68_07760 [Desulfobacterales bacterium]|nr:hypothetical protein [Desulfobacterales bacterium]